MFRPVIWLFLTPLMVACVDLDGQDQRFRDRELDAVGADTSSSADAGFDEDAVVDLDAEPLDLAPGEDAPAPRDAEPLDLAPGEDAPAFPDADPPLDAEPGMDAVPGMDVDGGMTVQCPQGQGSSTMPAANMSFFVTSVGNGAAGGNYGGLAGADERCRCLAAQVGQGNKTWRAYLSTVTPRVNARDRIGTGPWFNFNGTQIALNVPLLHSAPPSYNLMYSERGDIPPNMEHDILTGSAPDGTLYEDNGAFFTCNDWTDGTDTAFTWVGHSNWNDPIGAVTSWNSDHNSPCDQASLAMRFGTARLYCFATD